MSFRGPKYRHHKGSGQALVQINRERIYLGVYDSPESHEKYRRLVAEWLSGNEPAKSPTSGTAPTEGGTPMSLSRNQRDLLVVAVILFGSILVCAVAYAVLPGFRVHVHRVFHEAFNWLEKHVLKFHL